MMKSSENTFMIIAIIAVCLAVFNLAITINKIGEFQSFTGYVTDTGTANLTILPSAVINFTNDEIDWGSGNVNESIPSATLSTEGVMNGTGWNNITSGLVLENIGNVNVTLNFSSSNDADGFIGGDSPTYKWKGSENETGSCDAGINITSYTNVNTDAGGTHMCVNLGYDTLDTIILDLEIVVPSDAFGVKGSVITAIGTAVS